MKKKIHTFDCWPWERKDWRNKTITVTINIKTNPGSRVRLTCGKTKGRWKSYQKKWSMKKTGDKWEHLGYETPYIPLRLTVAPGLPKKDFKLEVEHEGSVMASASSPLSVTLPRTRKKRRKK